MEFSLNFFNEQNRKSNQTQTLNKRDVINAGRHYQQSFKQHKKGDCCFIDLSKKNSGFRSFFVSFAFYPNICYWKGFRAMLGGLKNNDWRITMRTYCSNRKTHKKIFISFWIKKENGEKIFISFFFVATVLPISDLWLNVCR